MNIHLNTCKKSENPHRFQDSTNFDHKITPGHPVEKPVECVNNFSPVYDIMGLCKLYTKIVFGKLRTFSDKMDGKCIQWRISCTILAKS